MRNDESLNYWCSIAIGEASIFDGECWGLTRSLLLLGIGKSDEMKLVIVMVMIKSNSSRVLASDALKSL